MESIILPGQSVTIKVEISEPVRLDMFLAQKFPDNSRSFFQKLILYGHVKINDIKAVKYSILVKNHDVVTIDVPKKQTLESKYMLLTKITS